MVPVVQLALVAEYPAVPVTQMPKVSENVPDGTADCT